MISIPPVTAAGSAAQTGEPSASAGTNAALFAQLLKARLDSSMLQLGESGMRSSGSTSGLMDVMLMSQLMGSSAASGGIDSAALQELITQMKQPDAAPVEMDGDTAGQAASGGRKGGIYVSRVYTPDIAPAGSWPEHTLKHQNAAVSALTRVGDPYSQSRRGQGSYVDCSYLTQWAYAQNGISLPSIASEQARVCVEKGWIVPKSEIDIGDLVFWNRDDCSCGRYGEIHHVGIYLGDGQVLEASSSQGKVVINDLWGEAEDPPWHLAFFARPQA